MDKLIKKGFLIGLGVASSTKKKAEALMRDLVKKGVMSRRDKDGLIRKMLAEANRERKRIEKFVKGEVRRELKKAKPMIKKAGAKAARRGKKAAARARRIAKQAAKKIGRKR